VATTGLVVAHTRHATSRAGDPHIHDHLLFANLAQLKDGTVRAANTRVWTQRLEEAAKYAAGQSAQEARRLGYAIDEHPPV
jgi:conjugative relaxase-like TrwC/TraI family protein